MHSIIIPYNTLPERRSVHEWVLRFYQCTYPSFEVVPSLYEATPWNKGKAINEGVRKARSDKLVIVDADTIILPEQLKKALDNDWAIPFTIVNNLTKCATKSVLTTPAESTMWAALPTDKVRESFMYAGGVWVISREVFESAGGIDERFEGWGGEDESTVRSLDVMFRRHEKIEGEIYHLWHPSSSSPETFKQTNNYQLYRRYRGAGANRGRMERLISEREPKPTPPAKVTERPLVNILTRTSGRPDQFRRCRESILKQKFNGDVRHIVCIDGPCEYAEGDVIVPGRGLIAPEVPPKHRRYRPAPYNLFINDALEAVEGGWVYVLDDDDEFLTKDALARLEPHMNDRDNLVVCRFLMSKSVIPASWGEKLVMNDVPGSSILYHSDHKADGHWHGQYCGDFFAANNLVKKGLKLVWVNEVVAGTQVGPSEGKTPTHKYKPWAPRGIAAPIENGHLSIIIPVMNQSHYTRAILSNIRATVHMPYEVIVVDNGSTDDTAQVVAAEGVKLIHNERNRGVYFAWNQGLRDATGDHLAVINNDLVLPDKWAETLIGHGHDAVCPSYTSWAGVAANFTVNNEMLRARRPRVVAAGTPGSYKGFAGFCFMLSRAAWEKVGEFDEKYFYWFGDNDYYNRLKAAGITPSRSTNVVIHHYVGKTLDTCDDFPQRRETERRIYEKKWCER